VRIPERPSVQTLFHAAVALGVFIAFGVLSMRHVGGSVFLSDQSDQLQFFERFLRFEPEGLWGPIMSSPDPPTRSLGPLGGILFGLPVALGFGINAVQAVTSALLVVTTAGAFVALARLDLRLAWVWVILLLANTIVWWNVSMLWANTLLMPAGNVLLMFMAWCLRRPSLALWCGMLLTAVLAAHISLVAITALPPIAIVGLCTLPVAWRHRPGRGAMVAIAAVGALAFGPYLLAEMMTGFDNTQAIVTQATNGRQPQASDPVEIALPLLQRAADPVGVLQRAGVTGWPAVMVGAAIAAASLLAWGVGAWGRRREDASEARAIFWLVAASLAGIGLQAAFFVHENRELLSYHYVAILVPMYGVPPAALAAWVLARGSAWTRDAAAAMLAVACLAMLAWRAPDWADDYWERTPWTYDRIAAAVDSLCGPQRTAHTVEGPGFRSVMPGHDGVLKYLMTRGFVACRYDEGGDRILAATREGGYGELRQEPDGTYRLVDVAEPGIALYQRERSE
jgi:hypothetical protein